jgi:dTDP-4-dehydrorhamnose 3,5-epimerase
MTPDAIRPVDPEEIQIDGARPIGRTFHYDPRGFLLETLRKDDTGVRGAEFAMSYTSATVPNEFRDADRWHAHRIQTDRFVVLMGEMILALYDARQESSTRGLFQVVRMVGAPFDGGYGSGKRDVPTSLVPIPPGVYHCVGNLSDRPFVLTNFPTELYDPGDEGRIPFRDVRVEILGGPFAWDRVARAPAAP